LNDQQLIEFGKNLLENLPVQYRNHTIILNSALHMLMQNGEIFLGEKLFSRMNKDTTSYGVMMSGKKISLLHLFNYVCFSLVKAM